MFSEDSTLGLDVFFEVNQRSENLPLYVSHHIHQQQPSTNVSNGNNNFSTTNIVSSSSLETLCKNGAVQVPPQQILATVFPLWNDEVAFANVNLPSRNNSNNKNSKKNNDDGAAAAATASSFDEQENEYDPVSSLAPSVVRTLLSAYVPKKDLLPQANNINKDATKTTPIVAPFQPVVHNLGPCTLSNIFLREEQAQKKESDTASSTAKANKDNEDPSNNNANNTDTAETAVTEEKALSPVQQMRSDCQSTNIKMSARRILPNLAELRQILIRNTPKKTNIDDDHVDENNNNNNNMMLPHLAAFDPMKYHSVVLGKLEQIVSSLSQDQINNNNTSELLSLIHALVICRSNDALCSTVLLPPSASQINETDLTNDESSSRKKELAKKKLDDNFEHQHGTKFPAATLGKIIDFIISNHHDSLSSNQDVSELFSWTDIRRVSSQKMSQKKKSSSSTNNSKRNISSEIIIKENDDDEHNNNNNNNCDDDDNDEKLRQYQPEDENTLTVSLPLWHAQKIGVHSIVCKNCTIDLYGDEKHVEYQGKDVEHQNNNNNSNGTQHATSPVSPRPPSHHNVFGPRPSSSSSSASSLLQQQQQQINNNNNVISNTPTSSSNYTHPNFVSEKGATTLTFAARDGTVSGDKDKQPYFNAMVVARGHLRLAASPQAELKQVLLLCLLCEIQNLHAKCYSLESERARSEKKKKDDERNAKKLAAGLSTTAANDEGEVEGKNKSVVQDNNGLFFFSEKQLFDASNLIHDELHQTLKLIEKLYVSGDKNDKNTNNFSKNSDFETEIAEAATLVAHALRKCILVPITKNIYNTVRGGYLIDQSIVSLTKWIAQIALPLFQSNHDTNNNAITSTSSLLNGLKNNNAQENKPSSEIVHTEDHDDEKTDNNNKSCGQNNRQLSEEIRQDEGDSNNNNGIVVVGGSNNDTTAQKKLVMEEITMMQHPSAENNTKDLSGGNLLLPQGSSNDGSSSNYANAANFLASSASKHEACTTAFLALLFSESAPLQFVQDCFGHIASALPQLLPSFALFSVLSVGSNSNNNLMQQQVASTMPQKNEATQEKSIIAPSLNKNSLPSSNTIGSMADLLALEEEHQQQHQQQHDEENSSQVNCNNNSTVRPNTSATSSNNNNNNNTNSTSFWQTILDLSSATDSLQLTNASTCREGHPLQVCFGTVPNKENYSTGFICDECYTRYELATCTSFCLPILHCGKCESDWCVRCLARDLDKEAKNSQRHSDREARRFLKFKKEQGFGGVDVVATNNNNNNSDNESNNNNRNIQKPLHDLLVPSRARYINPYLDDVANAFELNARTVAEPTNAGHREAKEKAIAAFEWYPVGPSWFFSTPSPSSSSSSSNAESMMTEINNNGNNRQRLLFYNEITGVHPSYKMSLVPSLLDASNVIAQVQNTTSKMQTLGLGLVYKKSQWFYFATMGGLLVKTEALTEEQIKLCSNNNNDSNDEKKKFPGSPPSSSSASSNMQDQTDRKISSLPRIYPVISKKMATPYLRPLQGRLFPPFEFDPLLLHPSFSVSSSASATTSSAHQHQHQHNISTQSNPISLPTPQTSSNALFPQFGGSNTNLAGMALFAAAAASASTSISSTGATATAINNNNISTSPSGTPSRLTPYHLLLYTLRAAAVHLKPTCEKEITAGETFGQVLEPLVNVVAGTLSQLILAIAQANTVSSQRALQYRVLKLSHAVLLFETLLPILLQLLKICNEIEKESKKSKESAALMYANSPDYAEYSRAENGGDDDDEDRWRPQSNLVESLLSLAPQALQYSEIDCVGEILSELLHAVKNPFGSSNPKQHQGTNNNNQAAMEFPTTTTSDPPCVVGTPAPKIGQRKDSAASTRPNSPTIAGEGKHFSAKDDSVAASPAAKLKKERNNRTANLISTLTPASHQNFCNFLSHSWSNCVEESPLRADPSRLIWRAAEDNRATINRTTPNLVTTTREECAVFGNILPPGTWSFGIRLFRREATPGVRMGNLYLVGVCEASMLSSINFSNQHTHGFWLRRKDVFALHDDMPQQSHAVVAPGAGAGPHIFCGDTIHMELDKSGTLIFQRESASDNTCRGGNKRRLAGDEFGTPANKKTHVLISHVGLDPAKRYRPFVYLYNVGVTAVLEGTTCISQTICYSANYRALRNLLLSSETVGDLAVDQMKKAEEQASKEHRGERTSFAPVASEARNATTAASPSRTTQCLFSCAKKENEKQATLVRDLITIAGDSADTWKQTLQASKKFAWWIFEECSKLVLASIWFEDDKTQNPELYRKNPAKRTLRFADPEILGVSLNILIEVANLHPSFFLSSSSSSSSSNDEENNNNNFTSSMKKELLFKIKSLAIILGETDGFSPRPERDASVVCGTMQLQVEAAAKNALLAPYISQHSDRKASFADTEKFQELYSAPLRCAKCDVVFDGVHNNKNNNNNNAASSVSCNHTLPKYSCEPWLWNLGVKQNTLSDTWSGPAIDIGLEIPDEDFSQNISSSLLRFGRFAAKFISGSRSNGDSLVLKIEIDVVKASDVEAAKKAEKLRKKEERQLASLTSAKKLNRKNKKRAVVETATPKKKPSAAMWLTPPEESTMLSPFPKRAAASSSSSPQKKKKKPIRPATVPPPTSAPPDVEWHCSICTFINDASRRSCEMCDHVPDDRLPGAARVPTPFPTHDNDDDDDDEVEDEEGDIKSDAGATYGGDDINHNNLHDDDDDDEFASESRTTAKNGDDDDEDHHNVATTDVQSTGSTCGDTDGDSGGGDDDDIDFDTSDDDTNDDNAKNATEALPPGQYSCAVCTFFNLLSNKRCEMCGTERKAEETDDKITLRCQNGHLHYARPVDAFSILPLACPSCHANSLWSIVANDIPKPGPATWNEARFCKKRVEDAEKQSKVELHLTIMKSGTEVEGSMQIGGQPHQVRLTRLQTRPIEWPIASKKYVLGSVASMTAGSSEIVAAANISLKERDAASTIDFAANSMIFTERLRSDSASLRRVSLDILRALFSQMSFVVDENFTSSNNNIAKSSAATDEKNSSSSVEQQHSSSFHSRQQELNDEITDIIIHAGDFDDKVASRLVQLVDPAAVEKALVACLSGLDGSPYHLRRLSALLGRLYESKVLAAQSFFEDQIDGSEILDEVAKAHKKLFGHKATHAVVSGISLLSDDKKRNSINSKTGGNGNNTNDNSTTVDKDQDEDKNKNNNNSSKEEKEKEAEKSKVKPHPKSNWDQLLSTSVLTKLSQLSTCDTIASALETFLAVRKFDEIVFGDNNTNKNKNNNQLHQLPRLITDLLEPEKSQHRLRLQLAMMDFGKLFAITKTPLFYLVKYFDGIADQQQYEELLSRRSTNKSKLKKMKQQIYQKEKEVNENNTNNNTTESSSSSSQLQKQQKLLKTIDKNKLFKIDLIPDNAGLTGLRIDLGDGDPSVLRFGKAVGPQIPQKPGRYYFEATCSDPPNCPGAFGVADSVFIRDHVSTHVGGVRAAIGHNFRGETSSGAGPTPYPIRDSSNSSSLQIFPTTVVGCLIDTIRNVLRFSINGVEGENLPIPSSWVAPFYPVFSTSRDCHMHVTFENFRHCPAGAEPVITPTNNSQDEEEKQQREENNINKVLLVPNCIEVAELIARILDGLIARGLDNQTIATKVFSPNIAGTTGDVDEKAAKRIIDICKNHLTEFWEQLPSELTAEDESQKEIVNRHKLLFQYLKIGVNVSSLLIRSRPSAYQLANKHKRYYINTGKNLLLASDQLAEVESQLRSIGSKSRGEVVDVDIKLEEAVVDGFFRPIYNALHKKPHSMWLLSDPARFPKFDKATDAGGPSREAWTQAAQNIAQSLGTDILVPITHVASSLLSGGVANAKMSRHPSYVANDELIHHHHDQHNNNNNRNANDDDDVDEVTPAKNNATTTTTPQQHNHPRNQATVEDEALALNLIYVPNLLSTATSSSSILTKEERSKHFEFFGKMIASSYINRGSLSLPIPMSKLIFLYLAGEPIKLRDYEADHGKVLFPKISSTDENLDEADLTCRQDKEDKNLPSTSATNNSNNNQDKNKNNRKEKNADKNGEFSSSSDDDEDEDNDYQDANVKKNTISTPKKTKTKSKKQKKEQQQQQQEYDLTVISKLRLRLTEEDARKELPANATSRDIIEYCCVHQYDEELKLIKRGFTAVCPSDAPVTSFALRRRIMGDPFTIENTLRHLDLSSLAPSLKQTFIDILTEDFDEEQRSKLFHFGCGQAVIPLPDKKKLVVADSSTLGEKLCRASTCAYQMTIPKISDRAELRRAILNSLSAGIGGFGNI